MPKVQECAVPKVQECAVPKVRLCTSKVQEHTLPQYSTRV